MNINKINKILNNKEEIKKIIDNENLLYNEKIIELTIPGKPENYVRERVVKGHAYNPKKKEMVIYKNTALQKINNEEREFLKEIRNKDCQISLSFIFYMPTQKNSSIMDACKKELGLILPTTTPDCDNLIKFNLDALHDVFYDNDAKVVEVSGIKKYSIKPRTEILCKIKYKI